ncbi:PPOX class F420-dependent oxidoreductase [Actinomycetes bacterium KLBMP 9759]
MNTFTAEELGYLRTQPLGRFATVDEQGRPQVRPVGFFLDPETGAVVIGGVAGSNMAGSRKYRNAAARPQVALVVDDVDTRQGWEPRGVEIRGTAETRDEGGAAVGVRLGASFPFDDAWLLLHPLRVLSWGLTGSAFDLNARDVA